MPRVVGTALPLLAWLVVAPVLAGCPSDFCLVKVCNAGSCSCSWSTCPSGASYDTNRNVCVCDPGRVSLGGSCLNPAEANAYCGKGFHYEQRGCVHNQCPPGQEIDQESGGCLAKQQMDQVAQNMGVPVGQGQKLGCPAGTVLVVEGSKGASCVPPSSTCSRDEVWNGQACVKAPQCPPGSVFDTAKNSCVTYASGDKDEATVDVVQWTQASYGPENGGGTAAFCSGFSRSPLAFGVGPGGAIRVRITVGIRSPGNMVAQSQVATAAVIEGTTSPVTASGAMEIQKSAQEILTGLVRQGGKSNVDNAGTHVTCVIVNSEKPRAVPTAGGA